MDSPRLRGLCASALSVVVIGAATASTAAGPRGNAAQEPESITLTPGETETTKTVFKQGEKYRVQVSGAVTEVYPKQGDQQMTCVTDAFYQRCTGGPNSGPPSRFPGITVKSKFANGAGLERYSSSGLPPFNSGHNYTLTLDNVDPGTFELRAAAGANPGPGTEVRGSFTVTITPPEALTVTLGDLARKVEVAFGGGAWEPATGGMKLKKGDKIHTGFKAGVTLTFPDGSTIRVLPMSLVEIQDLSRGADNRLRVRIWLRLGELAAKVNRLPGAAGDFHVKTPTTTASVRGTKFSVLHDGTATIVAVTESSVDVTANNGRRVVVPAGKETRSTAKSVSTPVAIGHGEKRGGFTAAQARKRLAAKLATGLRACKFDVVSSRLAPAKGGWNGSFVIVGARQGIDDKPKGTAKYRLRGKRVSAANPLAKRIARGCR